LPAAPNAPAGRSGRAGCARRSVATAGQLHQSRPPTNRPPWPPTAPAREGEGAPTDQPPQAPGHIAQPTRPPHPQATSAIRPPVAPASLAVRPRPPPGRDHRPAASAACPRRPPRPSARRSRWPVSRTGRTREPTALRP